MQLWQEVYGHVQLRVRQPLQKCVHHLQSDCTETNHFYIGNTRQYYKAHMAGHYQDVQNLVRTGQTSDSFAKYFCAILLNKTYTTQNPGKVQF